LQLARLENKIDAIGQAKDDKYRIFLKKKIETK
jgi:hypothetical protein